MRFDSIEQIRAHRFAGNFAEDDAALAGFKAFMQGPAPECERLEAARLEGAAFGEMAYSDEELRQYVRSL